MEEGARQRATVLWRSLLTLPWSPGSCIYEEAAEDVKVFIDDIVMIDIIVEL